MGGTNSGYASSNPGKPNYPTIEFEGTDGRIYHMETGWEDAFITSYERTGSVPVSAQRALITPKTVRRRRAVDAQFAERMREAQENAVELLETAAWNRARDGVVKKKAIYFNGRQVGEDVTVEYSDQLLIFLLKANKPEKYRESVNHTVAVQEQRNKLQLWAEGEGND